MPDVACHDAFEVVRRTGYVDELERGAERDGGAVATDLDGELCVDPQLLRAARAVDAPGRDLRRRGQVTDDGLEVLLAGDDAAPDLPADALRARRQPRAPLEELPAQGERDTLVYCYETGTSASLSSCRSDWAFVAACATKPPRGPGLRLLLLKSTYAFCASPASSRSGSIHSRSSSSE